jgi:hypothetical protein
MGIGYSRCGFHHRITEITPYTTHGGTSSVMETGTGVTFVPPERITAFKGNIVTAILAYFAVVFIRGMPTSAAIIPTLGTFRIVGSPVYIFTA